MQSKLENIIKILESKYQSARSSIPEYMESSSGSIRYKLHPVLKSNFKEYSPYGADERFRVAAFDAGSLLVYETPSWNIAYVKLAFRSFDVNLKDKTCNTVQRDRVLEHDLLMLTEREGDRELGGQGARNEAKTQSSTPNTLKKNFESGSILKQMETEFILKQIKEGKVMSNDLLLIDGALGQENAMILEKHNNVVGVSKRTGHCINGYSASSFMALKANELGFKDKSWFYHPLVAKYENEIEPVSELVFGTFKGNSNVFRLDFPYKQLKTAQNQADFIKQRMHKLGICALDPKYKAYPYPLGAVHSDAVMRSNTQDQLKRYIKKHIGNAKKLGDRQAFEMLERDIRHADWYDSLRKGA